MAGSALVLPMEVRWMNRAASALMVLAGAAALAASLLWLGRTPLFPVRHIQLEGELQRNSVSTIRANAIPRLSGNFFGADLQRAREAFEAAPWVRKAVVRRVWPDGLAVRLEEHRAVALWKGTDDHDRLVNQVGEVFEANIGDVEDEDLPGLAGPQGSAPQMLHMLVQLKDLFARHDRSVDLLVLSGRGSWRVELDGGADIELGRGSPEEVLARVRRFVDTITQVTGHFKAPVLHADLRHPDGYAVRLRNVTIASPAPAQRRN
jgi:cell division protein FtsQ